MLLFMNFFIPTPGSSSVMTATIPAMLKRFKRKLRNLARRLGRLTRYFYNSLRQPIEVLDAQGHITLSNWTLSAGLSSIVDPSGHMTAWKYDSQNRPIEKDYPDSTTAKTTYELTTSRVKTVTDNKGQVATNTYNMDNTVANVAYTNATVATPTVSYTYDPVYPRVHTVSDPVTGTTTYNYNAVTGTLGSNMLGSVQTPLATISYSASGTPLYDELGRSLGQWINDSATGHAKLSKKRDCSRR
jgi:YD repeat-containing protein